MRADRNRAEARYHNLFDRVPVGLFRVSPERQIIEANPALIEMLGFSDGESLKQVDVKPEPFAGLNGPSIQVQRAKNERPWPIPKTARPAPCGNRFKDTRVIAGLRSWALARAGTLGWANNSAERDAERATQDVAGLSGRKDDGIERREHEPERMKVESHC